MTRQSLDQWEDNFIDICLELLDEEPLYPYEHLWKEGLTPKQAFEKYLKENPDYADSYYGRALANYNLNKYEDAISDFNQVIKLDKNFGPEDEIPL